MQPWWADLCIYIYIINTHYTAFNSCYFIFILMRINDNFHFRVSIPLKPKSNLSSFPLNTLFPSYKVREGAALVWVHEFMENTPSVIMFLFDGSWLQLRFHILFSLLEKYFPVPVSWQRRAPDYTFQTQ